MKEAVNLADSRVIAAIRSKYPDALIFRNEEVAGESSPHFDIIVDGADITRKLGSLIELAVTYDLIYTVPELKGNARKIREELLGVYYALLPELRRRGAKGTRIETDTETRRIHIMFDVYVYLREESV